MNCSDILDQLQAQADPDYREKLIQAGINPEHAFGITIPVLREMAKAIGTDHDLAEELWQTGRHEARILATMIDHPRFVTEAQMDRWVEDFNSWDLCDQCIGNLFDRMGELAQHKALAWSCRDEPFVKRAGFVLMARLAVGKKKGVTEQTFDPFWSRLIDEADDNRNFVKKAINWALRQIGKYSLALNARAIDTARQIQARDTPAARWIAADALHELESEAVQSRLRKKAGR